MYNYKKAQSILRFWLGIESLIPNEPPKKDKNNKFTIYEYSTNGNKKLPWLKIDKLVPGNKADVRKSKNIEESNEDAKENLKGKNTEKMPLYKCFFGIFEVYEFLDAFNSKTPLFYSNKDDKECIELKEKFRNKESFVFYVQIDNNGKPIAETFHLNMFLWMIGYIYTTKDINSVKEGDFADINGLPPCVRENFKNVRTGFEGYDKLCWHLKEELAQRAEKDENTVFDLNWYMDFLNLVVDKCKVKDLLSEKIQNVRIKVPKKKNEDEDEEEDLLFTSFYIKDLKEISEKNEDGIGKALKGYLINDGKNKIDIRKDENKKFVLERLHPSKFPQGRWPSKFPLYFSQQLAVNSIFEYLTDGGIFGINGPPGTGKTTLLRDIVAAIITERAKKLVKYENPEQAIKSELKYKVNDKNEEFLFYEIDPDICGYGIVVASSNNGAVENVTLELPLKKAISDEWDKYLVNNNMNLFRQIINSLFDNKEECWALVAIRLGKKENRQKFVDKFWFVDKQNDNQEVSKESEIELDYVKKNIQSKKPDNIISMQKYLEEIIKGNRDPVNWEEARKKFSKALKEEEKIRKELEEIIYIDERINKLKKEIGNITKYKADFLEKLKQIEFQYSDEKRKIEEKINSLREKINNLKKNKPSLISRVASLLGKNNKYAKWAQEMRDLEKELQDSESYIKKLENELEKLNKEKYQIENNEYERRKELENLRSRKQDLLNELGIAENEDSNKLLNFSNICSEEKELISPYGITKWIDARVKVFLYALYLHQAFIENLAKQFKKNLSLSVDILKGRVPADNSIAWKMGFESLWITAPVISTTFASFSRLFAGLNKEDIGWLLIDEAGQAVPQAAVGAIWRSKRVVVVGDPLQLEPICNIPFVLEEKLAEKFGLQDERKKFFPTISSVQILADNATFIGTWIGEDSDSIWVGCPLRVHRRCSSPMFDISNKIAYKGLMIQGKREFSSSLPESCWYDVKGKKFKGNWVEEEGEKLKELLEELSELSKRGAIDITKDVFIISPFRDVVEKCQEIVKEYRINPNKIGTIHTTQGKEAEIVVIVLGGSTEGARAWAASKPNLLNVAVTRAKERIYIIGNVDVWKNKPHFCDCIKFFKKVRNDKLIYQPIQGGFSNERE